MSFSGRRMREARIASGHKAEEIALEVGKSVFTVQGYELGRVMPPADVIGDIASAIGVSVAAFYDEPVAR